MRLSRKQTMRAILLVVAALCLVGCSRVRVFDNAVKNGDTEKVNALLKKQPDLISNKDEDGETPLEIASMFGHMDMMKLLLAIH